MNSRTQLRRVVLLSAVVLSDCGGSAESVNVVRVIRTDSAGIEVVTTRTRAVVAPVFATLDSTPGLGMGTLDGPPEEQFGSVRDVGPDDAGNVAVLDGQAAEIRIFGPGGTLLRTVGKNGQGPGELSFPSEIDWLGGDSLAAWDVGAGRITVFASDGTLGRIGTVAFDGYGRPLLASFFVDGRMVGGRASQQRDRAERPPLRERGDVVNEVDGMRPVQRIRRRSRHVVRFRRPLRAASPRRRRRIPEAHPEGAWPRAFPHGRGGGRHPRTVGCGAGGATRYECGSSFNRSELRAIRCGAYRRWRQEKQERI